MSSNYQKHANLGYASVPAQFNRNQNLPSSYDKKMWSKEKPCYHHKIWFCKVVVIYY